MQPDCGKEFSRRHADLILGLARRRLCAKQHAGAAMQDLIDRDIV
jgi:hypothetical protein